MNESAFEQVQVNSTNTNLQLNNMQGLEANDIRFDGTKKLK